MFEFLKNIFLIAMVDTNWGWGLKSRSRAGLEWRPAINIQAWLPVGWEAWWVRLVGRGEGGAVKAVWDETLQLPFRLLCARMNWTRELKGTIKKTKLGTALPTAERTRRNWELKTAWCPRNKIWGCYPSSSVSWTENEPKSSDGHGDTAQRERQEWGSPGGSGRPETSRKGRGKAAIFKGRRTRKRLRGKFSKEPGLPVTC